MTRMHIGHDYTGTPSIKVTLGDFPAKTTPDEEREKFLYSTKWGSYCSPVSIDLAPCPPGTGSMAFDTVPPGATPVNWTRLQIRNYAGSQINWYIYRNEHFPNLQYELPLFWAAYKSISSGRFVQNRNYNYRIGAENGAGVVGGFWLSSWYREARWRRNFTSNYAYYYFPSIVPGGLIGYGCATSAQANDGGLGPWPDHLCHKYLFPFNLPGNDAPLLDPVGPPTGTRKMVVQINSEHCRVAKQGYDARTATPSQLVFDANIAQARVLAAGDGPVPVGTSFHELGVEVPPNTAALVFFYVGSTILYPFDPREASVGAEYWFDGTRIMFSNGFLACRVRYIVLSSDQTPPTSGSNRVFRKFSYNGERHFQLIRPGAGDPPAFGDILVDTRWPVPQIIKQGYIPVTTNGPATHAITYDGTGMFPLILYTTHHGAGSEAGDSWSEEVRLPFMTMVRWQALGGTSGPGAPGGNATYVTYNNNSAVFRTYRGQPVNRWISASNGLQIEYDPAPIMGIRYYVLGIPAERAIHL